MHTSSEPDDQWEQHEPDWVLHNTDSLLHESYQWIEKNNKKFFLSWNTVKKKQKKKRTYSVVSLSVSDRKMQFGKIKKKICILTFF